MVQSWWNAAPRATHLAARAAPSLSLIVTPVITGITEPLRHRPDLSPIWAVARGGCRSVDR